MCSFHGWEDLSVNLLLPGGLSIKGDICKDAEIARTYSLNLFFCEIWEMIGLHSLSQFLLMYKESSGHAMNCMFHD